MSEMKRKSDEESAAIIHKVTDSGRLIPPVGHESEADPSYVLTALLDAQLQADKEVEMANRGEMINEIEKSSHQMNTNMSGISLSRSEWQTLKERWLK